ncbi:MAG: hypothetical protein LBB48_05645 [Treponema sp.]|nr:hypothetical protein [Treponema sp.]
MTQGNNAAPRQSATLPAPQLAVLELNETRKRRGHSRGGGAFPGGNATGNGRLVWNHAGRLFICGGAYCAPAGGALWGS